MSVRLTEMIPAHPEWLHELPITIAALRDLFSEPNLPDSLQIGMSETIDSIESLMISGDLLYRFSSSAESWARKTGTAGIAIKRGDEIVHFIVLAIN